MSDFDDIPDLVTGEEADLQETLDKSKLIRVYESRKFATLIKHWNQQQIETETLIEKSQ